MEETDKKPGRRKRFMVVAAAVIVVAIGAIVFWPGAKEPEYQGKKLSEWLEQYCGSAGNPQKALEAEEAIRATGSNAVPYLIEWLKSEPPAWRRKLLAMVSGRRFLGGPRMT